MKEIYLTRGKIAFVDEDDFRRANQFSWQAQKIQNGWIVKRGIWDATTRNNRSQSLASFLLNLPTGIRADHIDGNPFNNSRKNLRVCTKTENDRAFRRKAAGKSSRFRGVCWRSRQSRWTAQIESAGVYIHIGSFQKEEDAAHAYDAKAKELFGEFSHLNFP